MLIVTISWSLGIFGMGVYIYSLTTYRGFSVSTVSTGVTASFVIGALLSVNIGRMIARKGPRKVVSIGALALASGVALMPFCTQKWHVVASFLVLGFGMACLSTITVGSTLAPWFEKHQGRAMSTSMMGASFAGMLSTPLFMAGIKIWGFKIATLIASAIALLVVLPLALFVLKTRPQDMGLHPDGLQPDKLNHNSPKNAWTLHKAIATSQFKTVVTAFGIGLLVQVGFLSHHVPLAIPTLGLEGAATIVLLAAIASFIGRILLARYADHVEVRTVGTCVLLIAAFSLFGLAIFPTPWSFVFFSITYGLTVGNVTTLSPIIVRREFGAASFSTVYGFAAALIQLTMALGPIVYGYLRDMFQSYTPVLLLCSALNIIAASAVYWGKRRTLSFEA
jgi:MFS family permease